METKIDNLTEIWEPIIGFEGIYSVSNLGIVKRVSKERVLKNCISTGGYYQVGLFKNGLGKMYYTHRLVALHFIPNPENKQQINHKDCNKGNNNALNLEWATPKDNISHAIKNGLVTVCGSENGYAKITKQQALEIRHLYSRGGITLKQLGDKHNMSKTNIWHIVHRKTWTKV